MADSKITGLGQLSAKPADDDWLVIVDKSDTTMGANGSNKKIAADYFVRTNGTENSIDAPLTIRGSVGTALISSTGNTLELNRPSTNYVWATDASGNLAIGQGTTISLAASSIYVHTDGNVGIQDSTPSYELDVNGQCHASSFPTSSDQRLKTNIRPFNLSPSIKQKLNSINAYLFEWDDNYKAVDNFKRSDGQTKDLQIGFIAQEVKEAVPQLVTSWKHKGKDGNVIEDALAVDYTRFIPIMWEAIKELYQENAALKQRVTALENAS